MMYLYVVTVHNPRHSQDLQVLQPLHAELKSKLDTAEAAYEMVLSDRDECRDIIEKLSAEVLIQGEHSKKKSRKLATPVCSCRHTLSTYF